MSYPKTLLHRLYIKGTSLHWPPVLIIGYHVPVYVKVSLPRLTPWVNPYNICNITITWCHYIDCSRNVCNLMQIDAMVVVRVGQAWNDSIQPSLSNVVTALADGVMLRVGQAGSCRCSSKFIQCYHCLAQWLLPWCIADRWLSQGSPTEARATC